MPEEPSIPKLRSLIEQETENPFLSKSIRALADEILVFEEEVNSPKYSAAILQPFYYLLKAYSAFVEGKNPDVVSLNCGRSVEKCGGALYECLMNNTYEGPGLETAASVLESLRDTKRYPSIAVEAAREDEELTRLLPRVGRAVYAVRNMVASHTKSLAQSFDATFSLGATLYFFAVYLRVLSRLMLSGDQLRDLERIGYESRLSISLQDSFKSPLLSTLPELQAGKSMSSNIATLLGSEFCRKANGLTADSIVSILKDAGLVFDPTKLRNLLGVLVSQKRIKRMRNPEGMTVYYVST